MPLDAQPHRSLCLFAHYDAQDRVDAYVRRYLQALVDCGFRIVFVSTSAISDGDVESLSPLCIDVIRRDNVGLDFASWALAYERHGRGHKGELLLANDSVYGPVGDLEVTLRRLRALSGRVRGLVESQQHALHLQSWFVLLDHDAHRSQEFNRFIKQDFAGMSKREIIERGEIALSEQLRLAGFQTAALFSLAHRRRRGILNYNPTHTMWRSLIVDDAIPFIKVELLRDNPMQLGDLQAWRDVVGKHALDLVPLIEDHRKRLGENWAGRDAAADRPQRFLSMARFAQRDMSFSRKHQTVRRILHEWLFEALTWLERIRARL